MTPTSPPATCVLIGSDSLLIECGERLLARGWQISLVLSDRAKVRAWAQEQGLAFADAATLTAASLPADGFDWLFSITWLQVLPEFLWSAARRAAINFHDGPLPRYAGLNTPAWALSRGEARHGIRWHTITAGVDRGEILISEDFDLAPDETSLTLNMRCFEAGLRGFENMLPDLDARLAAAQPQDFSSREVFRRKDRLPGLGCLDPRSPAAQLAQEVRACEFGEYPNPFGSALLRSAAGLLRVRNARATVGTLAPGAVACDADGLLRVGTADGDLQCELLETLAGEPLSGAAALALLGSAGIATPGEAAAAALEETAAAEAHWTRLLRHNQDPELPQGAGSEERQAELPVPSGLAPEELAAAFCLYLGRIAQTRSLGLRLWQGEDTPWSDLLLPWRPLAIGLEEDQTAAAAIQAVRAQLEATRQRPAPAVDLPARLGPADDGSRILAPGCEIDLDGAAPSTAPRLLRLCLGGDRLRLESGREGPEPEALLAGFVRFASACTEDRPWTRVPLLSATQETAILTERNATEVDLSAQSCIHEQFARQAARTPEACAVAAADGELSYRELDERANRLARVLVEAGAGPETLVGLCMHRGVQVPVALLGILKAGAAYLPLDPDFPSDRLADMVADSGVRLLLCDAQCRGLLATEQADVLVLEDMDDRLAAAAPSCPESGVTPHNLAYSIYTSGSTGRPKGVLVEHRQVDNFFRGMDARIGTEPGVWLAVTSLSFDISVLELFWTLCRGFKLVVYGGVAQQKTAAEPGGQRLGLMMWASGGAERQEGLYDLLLESARFGDREGFSSIWIPERHFHAFGGLYPNPSVAAAAVAAVTERIGIRAGSVVLPLHHPLRVAEEWSVVDNLSGGRVGLAIASGWHPNDFVLRPEAFEGRKRDLAANIDTLKRLWRGEKVAYPNPIGEQPEVQIMPRPLQDELPTWVTAAGNPETFRLAGEQGHNLLTHLLGQSIEELAGKLQIYHEAWRAAGHTGRGKVTLMLHTLVGRDREEVREIVRGPMREYLATAADLLKNHVSSWSAVRTAMDSGGSAADFSLDDLAAEDMESLLDYSFERYFETSALFGCVESCSAMIGRLAQLEVDEIACLTDFGVDPAIIREHLPYLGQLNQRLRSDHSPRAVSMEDLMQEHGVTHLQCTPSMAAMLCAAPELEPGMAGLQVMMVGGEALSQDLATRLHERIGGRLLNMYGPTETTIWSATAAVIDPTRGITLGTPIANTSLYVLDAARQPLPDGAAGELYIGGAGVTRGYHERPELTAERFLPDPFAGAGEARMYRTGDLVRWRSDGQLEFLSRTDHQVKVRGYRIELGEIENCLDQHPGVRAAVVVARGEVGGDAQLFAHYIAEPGQDPSPAELKEHLRRALPEYMVPTGFRRHERFPETDNRKTDRAALAAMGPARPKPQPAPTTKGTADAAGAQLDAAAAAELVQEIWSTVLGQEQIPADANFFDLGGHSLLTIKVQGMLRDRLGRNVPLVDLFRHTTIRSLAAHLGTATGAAGETAPAQEPAGPSQAASRAARRRMARRGR